MELVHPMRVSNGKIGTEVRPSPCRPGQRDQFGKPADEVALTLGSRMEYVEPDSDEFA